MGQEISIVQICFAALLVIAILISTSGLLMIRSSSKSLQSEISSYNTKMEGTVLTLKDETFEEISRSKKETEELVDISGRCILEIQDDIRDLRKETEKICMRLDVNGLKEVKKPIKKEETPKETKTDSKSDDEKIKVAEPTPQEKRPLWKKIIQFWKWF